MKKTILEIAEEAVKSLGGKLPLKKIYELVQKERPEVAEETIRCAIYRDKKNRLTKIAKGIYAITREENSTTSLVIEGDGRRLDMIEDSSMDAIITDHAWKDEKAHTSGNQPSFVEGYTETCFRYNINDIKQKFRVLKDGAFCVEILPTMSETNVDYIIDIIKMFEQCGFKFYAKNRWKKEGVQVNTGRTEKDGEEIYYFTKGKPRRLSPVGKPYMTTKQIPSEFKIPPIKPTEKIHKAEKPIPLYEAILDLITMKNELVLDQFAGSGNLGKAAMNKGRFSVLYEILHENVVKIIKNLGADIAGIIEEAQELNNVQIKKVPPTQLSFI